MHEIDSALCIFHDNSATNATEQVVKHVEAYGANVIQP